MSEQTETVVVPEYSTEQMEELKKWKNKFKTLDRREWTDGDVITDAVRSTYVKKIEFINTHQVAYLTYPDDGLEFHNNGIFNFGNDRVFYWDYYCDNFY